MSCSSYISVSIFLNDNFQTLTMHVLNIFIYFFSIMYSISNAFAQSFPPNGTYYVQVTGLNMTVDKVVSGNSETADISKWNTNFLNAYTFS
jgi:hypothetical protein